MTIQARKKSNLPRPRNYIIHLDPPFTRFGSVHPLDISHQEIILFFKGRTPHIDRSLLRQCLPDLRQTNRSSKVPYHHHHHRHHPASLTTGTATASRETTARGADRVAHRPQVLRIVGFNRIRGRHSGRRHEQHDSIVIPPLEGLPVRRSKEGFLPQADVGRKVAYGQSFLLVSRRGRFAGLDGFAGVAGSGKGSHPLVTPGGWRCLLRLARLRVLGLCSGAAGTMLVPIGVWTRWPGFFHLSFH